TKPLAGSQQEVGQAVGLIAQRNEGAARDLVRQHIENTLNAAGKDVQGGRNVMLGAATRKALYGNQQAAANLRAAIGALPNGQNVVQGFDRVMTILEATGRRQPKNSDTAFNAILAKELERGGIVGETASVAASPGEWLTRARDLYQTWRYGQNTRLL